MGAAVVTFCVMAFTKDHSRDVVDFWAKASAEWFRKSPAFDRAFRNRFAASFDLVRDKRDGWADAGEDQLARLILLDQYPRNAFRGSPRMYATDPRAIEVARLAMPLIKTVRADLRLFMVLPFAHSEDLADQDISVQLHRQHLPSGVSKAKRHREIIQRFGRFPHRNKILGRTPTPAEISYLRNGGFNG